MPRNNIIPLRHPDGANGGSGHVPPASIRQLSEPTPWSNPRAYAPDPIESLRRNLAERSDLRIAQLRLRIHPPIDWVGVVCVGLAVFIVIYFTAEMLRAVL